MDAGKEDTRDRGSEDKVPHGEGTGQVAVRRGGWTRRQGETVFGATDGGQGVLLTEQSVNQGGASAGIEEYADRMAVQGSWQDEDLDGG